MTMFAMPDYVELLDHGVHCIDTGFHRPRFDAAYLVVDAGRAAFIDTGTNYAVPRLLAALAAAGLDRDAVDWVIPTHVHLDHAGGVGRLMHALPRARALVHPRGARHLIDPAALRAGAAAVYGEAEMDRSYGTLVPVPPDRVTTTEDGMTVALGARELVFADTPGHARHHHCVWDEASRGWFTGDTFGISYRELDTPQGAWILPTATPVQFEPDLLRASIQRLLGRGPERVYLTHYGCVRDVPRLGALLVGMIDAITALAQQHAGSPDRHAALIEGQLEIYARSLAGHGCTLPRDAIADLLAMDLELNAQGMAIWLDRRAAATAPPATAGSRA